MYSIAGYGEMITDRLRTDAYCEALRRAVKPGAVVLDIGTGAGIFALLACRFGARKVYAIESGDVIQMAREVAAANECSERVEFIQKLSTKLELPERADVIVSDIRGILPLFAQHLPSIIDARRRLLAPGGVLIPQRDTLWAAVVESPELYKRYTGPWEDAHYELDMAVVRPIAINTWSKGRPKPAQLLTEPKCWTTLDYGSIDQPNVRGELTWTASRAGTAYGFSLWFDAELAEGVGFSNSPMSPELIYGNAFFPLFTPVPIAAGDSVSVKLEANLVGDDYVWRWQTCVLTQGDPAQVKARFHQSTFFGAPLCPNRLHKRAANYMPHLSEDGQIDRFVLGLMDGERSLDQVARCLGQRFPARFATLEQALSHVSDLSQQYS